MGCGQSKVGEAPTSNIAPHEKPKDNTPVGSAKGTPTKVKVERPTSKTIKVKETNTPKGSPLLKKREKERPPLLKRDTWTGSTDSLNGDNRSVAGDRGGSAVSKVSHHSSDSGFEDKEYQGVITENSCPEMIQEVEDEFNTPTDLDLGVVGKAVPQRLSAKDKERLDEQRVLASLRDEGLIHRPVSRAAGGFSFEIVMEQPAAGDYLFDSQKKKPPARLEKLEKRKKKKKKMSMADIEAKLEQAQERRRQLEQEKLDKIQAVTNKSDVQNALDAFASRQQNTEERVRSKEEIAAENREKRLREMRDKLRAKQEHAERVRQRKQLEAMNTDKLDDEQPES